MQPFHRARDQGLLDLRRAGSASDRAAAARKLCELAEAHSDHAAELAEVLPTLIADGDGAVRRAGVVLAAITLDDAEARELFGRSLQDPDAGVRLEAAGRLADLKKPETRGALAAALGDTSFGVRFEAARGMASLGHPAGREVLVAALDQADLRFRAIGALAELGDPQSVPALQALVKRFFLPAFDRTQAAGALARLGDASGAEHLLARTRKRWSVDRSLALELCGEVRAPGALERLCEVVSDPRDTCRGAAARGLGRLGDPRGVVLLSALLEDGKAPEDVRLDAAEGLCRLGTAEARAAVEAAKERWPRGEGHAELVAMLEEMPA